MYRFLQEALTLQLFAWTALWISSNIQGHTSVNQGF